jgi:hypothetical protein
MLHAQIARIAPITGIAHLESLADLAGGPMLDATLVRAGD